MIDMRTLLLFVRVSKFVTMTISSIDISISQITNRYNNKNKRKIYTISCWYCYSNCLSNQICVFYRIKTCNSCVCAPFLLFTVKFYTFIDRAIDRLPKQITKVSFYNTFFMFGAVIITILILIRYNTNFHTVL